MDLDEEKVKRLLRSLGQPAILFGENDKIRVERLKKVLEDVGSEQDELESHEPTIGTEELLEIRHKIAGYSLYESSIRLEFQRLNRNDNKHLNFIIKGSQVCDSRVPINCSFNESGDVLGIAGWSGITTLYSIPSGSLIKTLEGHSEKVQSIHLAHGLVATGSFDTNINVYYENAIVSLRGHMARVNKVVFHQLPNILLSCSHDKTWKLWDYEKSKCVLTQDGHGRGVYCLSLHPDGGLIATGDLAGVGILWDLRTGSHILTLRGHVKQMLCISISENGHTISTGSDDNSLKIWDIRKRGLVYSIPAHTKLISSTICSSNFIGSASYDGTAKIWSTTDYSLLQTFTHENKVTDMSYNNGYLATTSFDKTFKLWQLN